MNLKTSKNFSDYIFSNSEIGILIKQRDWGKHPLGDLSGWPKVLIHHLNTMLNSESPMCLFWGEELFCFYNNAFRPSLGATGKHPDILGLPAKEAWREVWDTIEPLLSKVKKTGEPTWYENSLIPIYRNGHIEDVYWSFGYSPIYNDNGIIVGVLIVVNETTDAVVRLQKLEETKNQFQFAIEAAQLGTWDYDLVNQVFTTNKRLRKWLGFKDVSSITYDDFINGIADKDRNRVKAKIQKALNPKKQENYDIKYTIINKNKAKKRIVKVLGRTWFNEQNEVYRFNGTMQDITDQFKLEKERKLSRIKLEAFSKELEEQIQDRTEKLQESNRMLTVSVKKLKKANENLQSFAYVSSHDLQEPLRKIQMFISRILDGNQIQKLPKEFKYFERISSSAERMRILIKDLLSFSRVGNVATSFEIISLQNLIEDLIGNLNEEIDRKILIKNIEVPVKIRAIAYQMEQLFLNLLTNSIKFASKERELCIQITAEKIASSTNEVIKSSEFKHFYKITYSDNGIGFDPKYNSYIFDVFKRLHSRDTYPGTGIGLAIVKQIVDNHNGFVQASGEINNGATFTLFLPVYNEV